MFLPIRLDLTIPTRYHDRMINTGNITKIVRKNKAGTPPTVRYRYRLGSKGKPTFHKTRREAEAHQKAAIAAQKAKGNSAMDVLRADTLGHVMTALGILKTSGLNSEHLVQACRSYSAAISTTALTVTLGEAVQEAFATAKYNALRPSTKRNYRYRWLRLVNYIGAETPLGAVSVTQLESFLAAQTVKSQSKYHVDLGVLFNIYFCRQLRHLSKNPMQTVVPPQRFEGNRRSPYSYTQLVSVLQEVTPFSELDVLAHLSFFTGMRTSECYNLTGDMVDLDREQLYLPFGYAKNKADRNVRLQSPMVAYLTACDLPSGRVFSKPYRALVDELRAACARAEVPWNGFTGRISYVSHAYEGVFDGDFHRLQMQIGHSINSRVTLRHYVNRVQLADTKVYFQLPLRRVDEVAWSDLVSPLDDTE